MHPSRSNSVPSTPKSFVRFLLGLQNLSFVDTWEGLLCPLGPGQYTKEEEGGCLRLASLKVDVEVGLGGARCLLDVYY